MSITTSEMTPADFAAVCGNGNNSGNDGMWGGNAWWIIILLLFGWGRGGYGGFGGGAGEGGGATPGYVLTSDFANIERKLDGVNNGLCDGFYSTAQQINGVQQTLCHGFSGINQNIVTNGYETRNAITDIGYALRDCCCDIKGGIKDVAYSNAMNTNAIDRSIYGLGNSLQSQIASCCCDIEKANLQSRFDAQAYNCNTLQAIDKLGDRIIDYMSTQETARLRDEVAQYRAHANNEYIINKLSPKCPEAAYIVQPPQQVTFPTNCCGQVNYASAGCGCGGF